MVVFTGLVGVAVGSLSVLWHFLHCRVTLSMSWSTLVRLLASTCISEAFQMWTAVYISRLPCGLGIAFIVSVFIFVSPSFNAFRLTYIYPLSNRWFWNTERYRSLSQIHSTDVMHMKAQRQANRNLSHLFPDTWISASLWLQPMSSPLLKITAVTSLFWPTTAPTQLGIRGSPQRRQEEAKSEQREGEMGRDKMVYIWT